MKLLCGLALLAAMAPVAGFAAVIVQDLPAVEAGADQAPFTINGLEFDSALGTLTGVTAELKGTYSADIIFEQTVPHSVASLVKYDIDPFSPAAALLGTAAAQTLTGVGNALTGSTEIDVSGFLSNLNFFETAGTGLTSLVLFDVYSSISGGGLGAAADNSTFRGDLILTYTYTPISEPAAFGIFGLGAALLGLAALQRARPMRSKKSRPGYRELRG